MAERNDERDLYARYNLHPDVFIHECCFIEDKVKQAWVPFKLWDQQRHTLHQITRNEKVVILKARQLGLTWLLVCYALWMMIFRQGSGILLFSRRDDEASELLDRIREVYYRLPGFIKPKITVDNAHELQFGELESWARAFSTTRHSGRMYNATLAIVDEADFIQELKRLMNAVKPTIDAGGRLVILSTVDKENRRSEFKRIWNQAVLGKNNFYPVFLPWTARPDRDEVWYQRQVAEYEIDDLYQEYPEKPEQALAARESSKRFSPGWLTRCRGKEPPKTRVDDLEIPGFIPYLPPKRGRCYLIGADPAEGNPGSDPSAAVVLNCETWEQAAIIHGTFEPDIFAGYLVQVAEYYNDAMILVERNNHGHAVLLALEFMGYSNLYLSPFDKKPGWLSTPKTKLLAVDHAAQVLREGSTTIYHEGTINELAMLEAGTLKAPEGEHDDLAMALINTLAGIRWSSYQERRGEGVSVMIEPVDPLEGLEF